MLWCLHMSVGKWFKPCNQCVDLGSVVFLCVTRPDCREVPLYSSLIHVHYHRNKRDYPASC